MFAEPTRSIPLRWGNYTDRYLAGLTLIISSLVGFEGANTYVFPMLLVGTTLQATGWLIMPAGGWRRVLVAFPCVATIWLLLTGPQSLALLAIPFLSWLLVRHRPLRSYLTLVFVVGTGVILANIFRGYEGMPVAFAVASTVVVASAWLARYLAARPSSF